LIYYELFFLLLYNLLQMSKGLKVKPTYEKLIEYIADPNDKISLPNRTAKFLRDGFILSQLDEPVYEQMEKQHDNALRNQFRENLIRQVASNGDIPHQHLREEHHRQVRVERIDRMLQTERNTTQGMEIQTDPVVDITTDEPEFMDTIDLEDTGIQATTAQTDQQTQAGAVAADYEAEVRRRQAEQEESIRRQQQAHAMEMERIRNEARDRLLAEQIQQEFDMSQANREITRLANKVHTFEEEAETQEQIRLRLRQKSNNRRNQRDKPEMDDPTSTKSMKAEDTSRPRGRPPTRGSYTEGGASSSTQPDPKAKAKAKSKARSSPPSGAVIPVPSSSSSSSPIPVPSSSSSSSPIPVLSSSSSSSPIPVPSSSSSSSPPPPPPPPLNPDPKAKAKAKGRARSVPPANIELDDNRNPEYWKQRNITKEYIRNQLLARGVTNLRVKDKKEDYIKAILDWFAKNP
jgi:chemotaxis protein histidine kinase CheA